MEYAITDRNLIFIYFKTLQDAGISSVIDFGMLLKRMGALSRRALDLGIPEKIRLVGVDLLGAPAFPVYDGVYNCILPALSCPEEHFSVGFVLALKGLCPETELERVLLWCASWCDKTLVDEVPEKKALLNAFGKREELIYEGRRFLALHRKEDR